MYNYVYVHMFVYIHIFVVVHSLSRFWLWDLMDCSIPDFSVLHYLYSIKFYFHWAFLIVQLIKNPLAMQETPVEFLGWEDSLEKWMTINSSILVWRSPWTVWFMELQTVRHNRATFTDFHTRHVHSWASLLLWPSCSFLLELLVIALCSSPVACGTPSNLGAHLLASYLLPLYAVHRVLQARILEWIAIPSPVNHILSKVFTMTHPSWVALNGMAHSFFELHKLLLQDKVVIYEWGIQIWIHVCVDVYMHIYLQMVILSDSFFDLKSFMR